MKKAVAPFNLAIIYYRYFTLLEFIQVVHAPTGDPDYVPRTGFRRRLSSSKERLIRCVGRLENERLETVAAAIRRVLEV